MDIKVSFSISMVIAVVLAEVASILMYNHNTPWGRRIGDRYLITAILSDVGLVVLLKFIIENVWRVSRWEDALTLSIWVAALYMCLEAPHIVHDSHSFSHFFFHSLHKFVITFVMLFSLLYFSHL